MNNDGTFLGQNAEQTTFPQTQGGNSLVIRHGNSHHTAIGQSPFRVGSDGTVLDACVYSA